MRIQIGRPAIVALALASTLSLVAFDKGDAGPKGDKLVVAPTALTAPAATTAGPALDPSWRKHVFVVTDSVMLGAKDAFIKTMRDSGWDVTFTGRVSLFMHNGLRDYVLPARNTGPIAVVALGYNSSWEKNRREYWAGIFDKQAEEMVAALKERGARKIVWVLLRELTPAMAAGARDMREYNSYAFYLPWVNERLRALQARHPEITLADWTSAATRQGLTEGMIHLSSQGAQLMAAVVKSAIVDQPVPGTPPVAVATARPPQEKPRVALVAEQPRVVAPQAPRSREIRVAEIRIGQLPPIEPVRQEVPVAPPPRLDATAAGPALDPSWPKHVFVVTDSVMLGAKQPFIKTMEDAGWRVTFTGRPALMLPKGIDDYVRQQRSTGPVAVVALGYNTLWEKERRNFPRWSALFDKQAEELIAALKERGARKIVWVLLRELTPETATASGPKGMAEYNKYAWWFPWVNERLRAIKQQHPEMTLADWPTAARQPGFTYDIIHLNPQGARLMADVVKTAIIGTGAPQPAPAIAAAPPRPMPVALTTPAEPPRVTQAELPPPIAARWPRAAETRVAETRPAKQPGADPSATTIDVPEPPTRKEREGMIALTRIRWANVVMLGDSMTERGPWAEITGCFYVANRGIGGDLSSGVLARVDDALRLKPSAVFLMIGINDISRNVPIPTIVGNVRRTIERINGAGAKVYLMLVLPVSRGYVPRMNPRVAELNAAYVTLARETNATVVDFRSDLSDDGALRADMTVDGLHLNPAGYQAWSEAITPLVQRHCQTASAPTARVSAAASELTTGSIAAPADPPAAPRASAPQPSIAVAEPEPTVARTAPAPARGEWMIQVGAYPDIAQAKEKIRAAQAVGKRVLVDSEGFTEKTVKAGRDWFRARFAGFDKASAAAACGYFKANAIDCVVVRD